MSKKYYYRTAGEIDKGDEDEKITPKHLWDGMREHTTMHGVAHVTSAKGVIKRSFWGFAMLFTVCCLFANLGSITDTYLSWEVDVTIKIQNQKELIFPAITICNMSPIRKSYFEGMSRRKREAPNEWNTTTVPPETFSSTTVSPNEPCCCSCCPSGTEGGSCSTCIENIDKDVCFASQIYTIAPAPPPSTNTPTPPTANPPTPPTVEGSLYPDRVAVRESFAEEEKLTETIVNLPAAEKQNAGTQLGDFILDCQYAGADCYLSDFEQFNNPTHGNCFIFNSGWNDKSTRKSHKAGRRYGLMLTLNIQQDEYVAQVGDTAGIRVVVGSQNRMPFPEDEGLTVSPGHSTSISLRQVLLTRLGNQYSDCVDQQALNIERNVYEELYDVEYTNIACLKTCYQKWVIKRCGCADPYFPREGVAFNNTDWKTCSAANLTEDDCKYGVGREFNENKLDCDCPVPCSEKLFQSVVSIGEWPSDVQKDDILEKLRPRLGNLLDDPFDPDKYKRNLIKMEIYYQEFNFESISERPAYDFFEFISNVGGTIGLWIGCSILTLVEFVEFFMDMVVLSLKKRQLRKNKGTSIGVKEKPDPDKNALDNTDFKPNGLPGYDESFKNNSSKANFLEKVQNWQQPSVERSGMTPTESPNGENFPFDQPTPPSRKSSVKSDRPKYYTKRF